MDNKKGTDNTTEREKFFKTLNNFIVTSGVLAAGIKAVTNGIATQVHEAKREAEKKAISTGLTAIGFVFAFIGAMQVITHYFDLSLYTNLIIGGLFLCVGLVVKMTR